MINFGIDFDIKPGSTRTGRVFKRRQPSLCFEVGAELQIPIVPLGIVAVEHPQKIVLVYPPASALVPGAPICKQAGYLPDVAGSQLLWLPEIRDDAPAGLIAWIESEALRLRDAGEFVDPPAE